MSKSLSSAPDASAAPPAQESSPTGGSLGRGNAAAQEAMKKAQGGGAYKVQRGDTLWGIAKAAYGNGALWSEIQQANPDKVQQGGDLIFAGSVLELPVVDPDGGEQQGSGGQTPAVGPDLRSTDFGVFEVYPDAFTGPLPATADGIQVVRESTFQQYQQEALTQAVNPDIDALEDNVSFERTVVTIAGEQVAVSSKAEAQHARRILQTLREVYGIEVDSDEGVDAIKADYTRVPETELDKLKTKEWEYKELAALERALAHFAPILGSARDDSSRSGSDQEISSVSKLDQAIDSNRATGQLDTTTLGEFFADSSNFSMFTAGTDSTVDFADNDTQLEGTAVHEIAHGLMKSDLPAFVAAIDYWTDEYTASGKSGAEAPVTSYGQTNAGEDLSESVMYFFVDPATLKSQCPDRHAWISTLVQGWSKSSGSP